MLAVGNDAQFRRLCTVLGVDEVAADTKYASNEGRVEHRAELIAILSSVFKQARRDVLLSKLEAAGVPAGPINTVAYVFIDPQVLHRQMMISLPAQGYAASALPSLRTPIRFSDAELWLERPAPRLGEHTDELRREMRLGLP